MLKIYDVFPVLKWGVDFLGNAMKKALCLTAYVLSIGSQVDVISPFTSV